MGSTESDARPQGEGKRSTFLNYLTLWVGGVNNIPNYAVVGGMLFLGLGPVPLMTCLVAAAVLLGLVTSANGMAGARWGIGFSLHLKSVFGEKGALLPGFLRGCVAAVFWFGLQTYTGSLALQIVVSRVWPGFSQLGGGASLLGLSVPTAICFLAFWALNLVIGLSGEDGARALGRFTAILAPIVYAVVIGMSVWAASVNGGLAPILEYGAQQNAAASASAPLVALLTFNTLLSNWSAIIVSNSDFTRNAESGRAQAVGQTLSFTLGYALLAVFGVVIMLGSSRYYGVQEWNIAVLIDRWESTPAAVVCSMAFLLATVSTNAASNIVPAAHQLRALSHGRLSYRAGALLAAVAGILVMPWRLMENSGSIYAFLGALGSVFAPIIGVMLASYYVERRQQLDERALRQSPAGPGNPYAGVNARAYAAVAVGLLLSHLDALGASSPWLANGRWFLGFGGAALAYLLLLKLRPARREARASR